MIENFYQLHPKTYDEQFWWKKDDVEFWKNLFFNSEASILELAAGTGRIGVPLLKENNNYLGLDISSSYCNYANQKILDSFSEPKFFNFDMTDFQFDENFDIIFIPFNSLLHLPEKKDLLQCFDSVKKHMHSKSKFYIDIFVPSPLFLYRPKDVAVPVMEFFNSRKECETYVDEIIDYDKKNEIAQIIWMYKNEESYYDEITFSMKMYYPDTMVNILNECGFTICNIWGDYEKNSFDETSNKQIYECKIKG